MWCHQFSLRKMTLILLQYLHFCKAIIFFYYYNELQWVDKLIIGKCQLLAEKVYISQWQAHRVKPQRLALTMCHTVPSRCDGATEPMQHFKLECADLIIDRDSNTVHRCCCNSVHSWYKKMKMKRCLREQLMLKRDTLISLWSQKAIQTSARTRKAGPEA